MGNTNLPQAGAAHEKQSRDTLRGAEQLTDAQEQEAREQGPPRVVAPNPAVSLEQALGGYTGTGHSPAGAT
ncbi:MAG TPA: hypothetical protein VFE77_16970 [Rhodanobacter sp.]|nr:hypothetical protein [Rhodanobacter sp.]